MHVLAHLLISASELKADEVVFFEVTLCHEQSQ